MAKYKTGDEVKSKAGGPKLVVDSVYERGSDAKEDPKYFCIWWVGNKRHREQFSEGGLDPWVADDA